jgi:hypothetical protein
VSTPGVKQWPQETICQCASANALAMKESALEFFSRVLPPDHPDIALSLYSISLSHEQDSDTSRALVCAREAVSFWHSMLLIGHPHLPLVKKRVAALAKRP